MDPDKLAHLIESSNLRTGREVDLQNAIEQVLVKNQVPYQREVILSRFDRPDFMVGDVAIEVKVEGSVSNVTRQLNRYASHDSVKGILLVTTRFRHRAQPNELNGKPVFVVHLLAANL